MRILSSGRRGMALAALALATPALAQGEEWRLVFAENEAVSMVDGTSVEQNGAQITFRMIAYWSTPIENGSIGIIGKATIDCVRKLMDTPGLQEIMPDGSTVLSIPDRKTLRKISPNTFGAVMQDRMCKPRWDKKIMNGIAMDASPALVAKSAFALLALGLDNEKAGQLASMKYWDEESLVQQLDAQAIPSSQRDAVRKILAAQTKPTPPPPPPIIPLASAVATGLVGRYSHLEHELGAGLELRADGTFRYGLTVGSLDETGTGRWTAIGRKVALVSEPRPLAPTITAGPVDLATGPFSIRVLTPNGRDVPGIDFMLEFDTGEALDSYLPGDVWRLPAAEKRIPRSVTFWWKEYRLVRTRLAIDGRSGRVATFIFNPNDFGVVDMTGLTVDADADKNGLTLRRPEGTMHFERQDGDADDATIVTSDKVATPATED